MSVRNTILASLVTTLGNIKKINGFHHDLLQPILRKFLYWDHVYTYPALMVLGGGEHFEDQLGPTTISTMMVRIAGYTQDVQDPEVESCNMIEDIIKCLETASYNPYHSSMALVDLDTDEGRLNEETPGIAMFVLSLKVIYKYNRTSP